MGRLGAAVDGMGAHQPVARLHRVLAAVRRARGLFLANLAVLAFSQMSGEQFLAWGWRVPFLLSIVLVGDRPLHPARHSRDAGVHAAAGREQDRAHAGARGDQAPAEGDHPLGLRRMAEQAPFYIFTAFIFAYGTGTLHVSRDFLLIAVLTASVLSFFSIPFFGHLSDRIGRKSMYMIGAAVTGVFGFVYFGC